MSNTPFFSQQHRRDIDRFWRCPKQMPIVIDLDLACDAQKKKNENKIVRLAPRVHCARMSLLRKDAPGKIQQTSSVLQ